MSGLGQRPIAREWNAVIMEWMDGAPHYHPKTQVYWATTDCAGELEFAT